MRNKKIAARIQLALARNQPEKKASAAANPNESPFRQLENIRHIIDRRLDGERNWTLKEIARRENIGYSTVYRALKGKPGFLRYNDAIRVTDTLYRSWLTALASGLSFDEFYNVSKAS